MSFITNLEPPVLLYVLTSVSEGLTTLGKLHGEHCFHGKNSTALLNVRLIQAVVRLTGNMRAQPKRG